MGVPERWLRTDGKAGSVDLSILAAENPDERPKDIVLRTKSRLWYRLSPTDEITIHPDNAIAPVHLEFDPWARITGNFVEESLLALDFIRKWVTERRHYPRIGEVVLANALITEGDRLIINGRPTSPIDVAWVTEYVDPSEATMTYGFMDGRPSIGIKPFANF